MKTLNPVKSVPKFRVVGIRANGVRVEITTNESREAAEGVVSLIRYGGGYDTLKIATDGKEAIPCRSK